MTPLKREKILTGALEETGRPLLRKIQTSYGDQWIVRLVETYFPDDLQFLNLITRTAVLEWILTEYGDEKVAHRAMDELHMMGLHPEQELYLWRLYTDRRMVIDPEEFKAALQTIGLATSTEVLVPQLAFECSSLFKSTRP